MKIYLIHSFRDADIVAQLAQYLTNYIASQTREEVEKSWVGQFKDNSKSSLKKTDRKPKSEDLLDSDIFYFHLEKYNKKPSESSDLWKRIAWVKMQAAHIVIFCLSPSYEGNSQSIQCEFEFAHKLKKDIYLLKLDNTLREKIGYPVISDINDQYENSQNKFVDDLKKVTNSINPEYRQTTINELMFYIKHREAKENIKSIIFPNWGGRLIASYTDLTDTDKHILLDQYRMMLDTSESLMARRQTLNSFYISLNCAVFALVGTLATFKPELQTLAIIIFIMSWFGVGTSFMWIRMIDAYGALNTSKYDIINAIEKELPASIFDAEWITSQRKPRKERYSSFTKREKETPKLFLIMYILIIILSILIYFGLFSIGS